MVGHQEVHLDLKNLTSDGKFYGKRKFAIM